MTITPSLSFRPVLTRNDDNNDVVFRCNDPDSGCLALTEDVSDVLCYCQQGGNLVPNNVPCVRGQSPYHQLPVIQLFFLSFRCSCDICDTACDRLHCAGCYYWPPLHVFV